PGLQDEAADLAQEVLLVVVSGGARVRAAAGGVVPGVAPGRDGEPGAGVRGSTGVGRSAAPSPPTPLPQRERGAGTLSRGLAAGRQRLTAARTLRTRSGSQSLGNFLPSPRRTNTRSRLGTT